MATVPDPEFDSLEEVYAAYYPEGDQPGGGDDATGWAIEPVDGLAYGWQLSRLYNESGGERYIVTRPIDQSTLEVLTPPSTPKTEMIAADTPFGDYPHFETEQAARDRYEQWVDNTDEEDRDADENPWTEWTRAEQVGNWTLYLREHTESDERQFAIGGRYQGTDIWIHPGGDVETERYAFESIEAAQQAYAAYLERVENGEDLPQPEGPPQNPPDPDPSAGTPGGVSGGSLGDALSNPLVLAGAAGIGYLAYRSYGGEP